MKNLKFAIIVSLLVILLSCGYRMAGFEGFKKSYDFSLERIANISKESEYSTYIRSSIVDFFNRHNMLNEKSDKRISIVVEKIEYKSNVLRSTGRAITSDLNLQVKITVKRGDKIVFNKTYTDSNYYTIYETISKTNNSKVEALRTGINNILMNFLNEYHEENNFGG